MDRLRYHESSEWLLWSDWFVVMTIVMMLLLGLIRNTRADEGVLVQPEMAFFDTAVECPPKECGPACCDPICHVLDPLGQDPLWSGRAEALLLWRDAPQSVSLYNISDAGDAGTGLAAGSAFNASNLASGMAAGPRFTLFRHTGDNGAIEFNYFRVQSFTATKSLPTVNAGYLQDDAFFCCPVTTPYNTVTGSLASSFQSFEINRRFPTDGGFQWLTGFRWVEWNDTFALSSVRVDNVTETYNTSTVNDLYGWQLGADSILLGLGSPWRLEGLAKAGVYYNQAGQASSASDPSFSLAVRTAKPATAFVGEIGLTSVYDVTDWFSVRAGYAAFWLDGLALATNQVDQCSICNAQSAEVQGPTHVGGGVFVQGITLGLEARW